MLALPPDQRGALRPAPSEQGGDGPGGTVGTVSVGPGYPHRPAKPQPPATPLPPATPWPPAAPQSPSTPRPFITPRPPVSPRPPIRPRPPAGPRPLPDAASVRLYLIPDSAPPYDAEGPTGPPATFLRAGAGPTAEEGSPHPRGRGGSGSPESPRPPAPRSRGLPGSGNMSPGWPAQFAQVLAETLAGSRSPRQLVPWTTERARDRIQRLGPQLSAGQQPRVRRVVTFHPTADAMEMTVVVGFGQRVHALAVRLERADRGHTVPGRAARPGTWLCTTVEAA